MPALVVTAFLLLLPVAASLLAMPAEAQGPALEPDARLPLPQDFIGAFGIRAAVSCQDLRVAWGGQLSSLSGFDWAYARARVSAPDVTAYRSPFETLYMELPEIHVAAPGDAFLYAGYDPQAGIWLAAEERDGSWRGPTVVLPNPVATPFTLASDGTGAFLAWRDISVPNGTLYVGQIDATGTTVASRSVVDADPVHGKWDVQLAARNGEVDVAWTRWNSTGGSAFYAHVVPGVPPTPLPITHDTATPQERNPSFAVFPNGTVLSTVENHRGSGPFLLGSYLLAPYTNFGPTFNVTARIGGGLPSFLDLLADPTGILHATWLDGDSAMRIAEYKVMYASSEDGGATFSAPDRIDSDPTMFGKDSGAFALGTNGDLFILWGDRRDGTGTPKPYLVRATLLTPHAAFTMSADAVFTGTSIQFDASGTDDGDRTLTALLWDFGDGATASGRTATHAFADAGDYLVTLTVTDDRGLPWSVCTRVTVAPLVTWKTVAHSSGFRIDIPSDWEVHTDRQVSGTTIDLIAVGPVENGFQTNVVVDTVADPAAQESQAYLQEQVTLTIAELRGAYPDMHLTGPLEYRTLSGYSAVSFVTRTNATSYVQRGVLVVSQALQRDWIIILSCDVGAYAEANFLLEHMLGTFAITLIPPAVVLGWVLAGVLAAVTVVIVLLVVRSRRKRRGQAAPPRPAPATPAAAASSCPRCRSSLSAGDSFCPECGEALSGVPLAGP